MSHLLSYSQWFDHTLINYTTVETQKTEHPENRNPWKTEHLNWSRLFFFFLCLYIHLLKVPRKTENLRKPNFSSGPRGVRYFEFPLYIARATIQRETISQVHNYSSDEMTANEMRSTFLLCIKDGKCPLEVNILFDLLKMMVFILKIIYKLFNISNLNIFRWE